MRLALCALLTLTPVGCRYHERDLTCDPVAAGCGGGEACAVSDAGAVICSCGDVTSAGRACGSGTSCAAAACVVNLPPTAVISRVVDGVLRVAANANAALTGRESIDPEGGALTYAWTFSGACGVPPSALDTRDLTLDTTGITDACTVTLVVTDDLGETAVATANIKAREVGAYVATVDQDASCRSAYDPASEDAQGTYDHPFCDLVSAIAAARGNSLPQVTIALNALITLTTTLEVADLTIAGGYTRSSSAPWTFDSPGNTSRIVTNNDLGGSPLIGLSGGTTGLMDLEVNTNTPCARGCTAIAVSATSATLTRTTVLASTNLGFPVTAVAVRAGASETSLHFDGGIFTVSNGGTIVGLDADGDVSVVADGTAFTAANSRDLGIGVRLGNGAVFAMHGGSIEAIGRGVSGVGTTIGLEDGRNADIDGVAVCGTAHDSCSAAASVTLDGAIIEAQNDNQVYGAVLLGSGSGTSSGSVTITNLTTITAINTGPVVGLATMDATRITIANTTIAANGKGTAAATDYVLAYRDGAYDTTPFVPRNFSRGLTFDATAFVANGAGTDPIESMSAVLLNGSQEMKFTNSAFSITGPTVPLAVNVAGAVATHATSNTAFDQNLFDVSGVIANWRVDAFADGCGTTVDVSSVCGTSFAGSSGLVFTGNVLRGNLLGAAAGGAKRVCALFGGTTGGAVSDNTVECSGQIAATTDEVNVGVWTIGSTNVRLERNHVYTDEVVASSNNAHTWFVGILDGLYPTFDSQSVTALDGAASNRLVANRNDVRIGALLGPSAYAVGVWYRGLTTRPLYNSIIDLRSQHNYGVILDQTAGDVQLNTIRTSVCESVAPCPGFGVGIYVLKGGTRQSTIRGNLFTVEALSDPNAGTYVVNHRLNGSTLGGIAVLSYNQYGLSGEVAGSAQQFYGTRNDANDFPGTPTSGQNSTSNDLQIEATLLAGAAVDFDKASPPIFCGELDSVQNQDEGNDLMPVAQVSAIAAEIMSDYHGSARETSSGNYDAGATERGTAVCAVPLL